ncbi:protein GLUTAMINE DUMPER 2-like [Cynara cardunculus var. scolymus]|uniref:protein GLUTAMINE DUMPER 2-like n=1 Tax=Cynara cardunculus var. scolymus TaxID=59895 RepID=UPI000D627CF8|nr:protein GLUTAMINE DUMPER 2-like [Cynara cardunculus var. scolymus]
MTPAQNTIAATTTIDGGLEWSSPIPYLFGGMFIAFSLIACALIILACSYKKVYSNNTSGGDEEKPYSLPNNTQLASEIVIVMPGDTNPTYLAKPLPHPYDIHQV